MDVLILEKWWDSLNLSFRILSLVILFEIWIAIGKLGSISFDGWLFVALVSQSGSTWYWYLVSHVVLHLVPPGLIWICLSEYERRSASGSAWFCLNLNTNLNLDMNMILNLLSFISVLMLLCALHLVLLDCIGLRLRLAPSCTLGHSPFILFFSFYIFYVWQMLK